MTTDAVRPLADPRPVPSLPTQVLRATVGTLAVVLVVGLTVGAWTTWGTAVSAKVFRVFGDPRIDLADGLTLSTAPRTVGVPTMAAVTWTAATETADIARGTGLPVQRLDAAGMERLDPRRFGHGTAAEMLADGTRFYGTPLGIVQTSSPILDPGMASEQTVVLRSPSPAVRRLSESGQEELLRRLVTAWGVAAGAAALGAHLEVRQEQVPRSLGARLAMPGADGICGSCASGYAFLAKDGSLELVGVGLEKLVGTRPVQVESAASAYDAVRHHLDGSVRAVDDLGPGRSAPGSVTSASLVIEGGVTDESPTLSSVLMWEFTDAEGNLVGQVPAVVTSG